MSRRRVDLDLLQRDDASVLDLLRDSSAGLALEDDGGQLQPTSSRQSAAGSTSSTSILTESATRNLTSEFTRFREKPASFLTEVGKHIAGTSYRSYDNYVGRRIFYRGFTDQMLSRVLKNPLLNERIITLADQFMESSPVAEASSPEDRQLRRDKVVRWLQDVTRQLAQTMICKFEYKIIGRVAYYIVMQILGRSYNQGLHVNAEEIASLKRTAAMAASKGQSLVFLPCHRSHIDYICMQAICFRLGISLPTIVAGDNLNIPVVGPALNRLGAMWMRRSFGDDQLYSALIQAYVDTLLSEGYNFECFIEGGRSRLGKLLPPKFGILKFIFDSILFGRVEDCWIVPVSTQYDRVIETESYVSELLGSQKRKETLGQFFESRQILSLKMGRVDIRFHDPWSLRDFISSQIDHYTAAGTKPPTFQQVTENSAFRTQILRSLGYRVLSDINEVSVVMPTALVGTVLLTLRGRGVGHTELLRRLEWLCLRIQERGGRVADFGKLSMEQILDRSLEVLESLIGINGDNGSLLERTYYAKDRFQLSFYRNMVIHLFVSDATVAVAMYTKIKQGGGPSNQRVPIKYLLEQCKFLSSLFAAEFVYAQQPGGIRANFWESIQLLRDQGVISITDDAASIELSVRERERGREYFDFYCFLLWPFCDGYWLAAASLFMLTPLESDLADQSSATSTDETLWVAATEFLETAQLLGKTIYAQGDLSYFEAVNKEMLRSAFAAFEDEGIIVVRRSKSGRLPSIMSLAPDWLPTRNRKDALMAPGDNSTFSGTSQIQPEGKLWTYVERISIFRREGKNRRDSPSVSMRVLALADEAGRNLKHRDILSYEKVERPESDALVTMSRATRTNTKL
ncbi:acyltransferase-domain-containing protein [Lipomyces oligophaga]|uniref:acyltransferase-domain-containing protein n=1 Tax=Lipomyces oligophaga TaxID=45792 RepID=UPI0034CF6963